MIKIEWLGFFQFIRFLKNKAHEEYVLLEMGPKAGQQTIH